jgi:hypothetical protein
VTREEIRLTLAAIRGEGPSAGPPSSASSRLLAAVVEDQERRIAELDRRMRVLEPCSGREPGSAHAWPGQFTEQCAFCKVTR